MNKPQRTKSDPLLKLKRRLRKTGESRYLKLFKYPLAKVFSKTKLNAVFNQVIKDEDSRSLFHAYLKIIDIEPQVALNDLNRIPEKGPLVVVANHPFNGIDAISLAALISEVRTDVRILGNRIIDQIPAIRDWNIPLVLRGNKQATQLNTLALRKAINWVKNGGVLIVFPANGRVRLYRKKKQIYDGRWSPQTAAIIRHAGAATLPVYFPGRLSHPIHAFGNIYPRLKSFLMNREFQPISRIELFIGKPLTSSELSEFSDNNEMVRFIKTKTYFLRNRVQPKRKDRQLKKSNRLQPVAAALDPGELAREIEHLPVDQCLCQKGDLSVYLFTASQGSKLLREIGRLREETFRAEKEGSGKSLDLDKYDQYYRHLILWNEKNHELIGAYRIGLSDEILPKYGVKGFYTHSLFRLKLSALEHLDTFLEMGRSFIRIEYQKQYSMLLLLWKGIAEFIVRNPQYRYLFGPVSISNDYNAISKNLIYYFLKNKHRQKDFSSQIKPRKPYSGKMVSGRQKKYLFERLKNIEDVSLLVSEIENDGKGVPILLKHYLKLNAKLLSFNVDKDFSSVLDGLILVDLLETDERFMARFTGAEGYRKFRKYYEDK